MEDRTAKLARIGSDAAMLAAALYLKQEGHDPAKVDTSARGFAGSHPRGYAGRERGHGVRNGGRRIGHLYGIHEAGGD